MLFLSLNLNFIDNNAPINVKPEGGGGGAYVGHLTFQKIFSSKSPPWGPKTGSNKIKYPHLREVISLKFIVVVVYILQPVVRSSVFVYRNECLPQKQPCFPASAPVNSKMAGTDVTSYQSSSQKKKQTSPPWGPDSKSNSRGWGRQKRSNAPHMPGVPPLGLNIDRYIICLRHYKIACPRY